MSLLLAMTAFLWVGVAFRLLRTLDEPWPQVSHYGQFLSWSCLLGLVVADAAVKDPSPTGYALAAVCASTALVQLAIAYSERP